MKSLHSTPGTRLSHSHSFPATVTQRKYRYVNHTQWVSVSGWALRSNSTHSRCGFRSDFDIKQEPVTRQTSTGKTASLPWDRAGPPTGHNLLSARTLTRTPARSSCLAECCDLNLWCGYTSDDPGAWPRLSDRGGESQHLLGCHTGLVPPTLPAPPGVDMPSRLIVQQRVCTRLGVPVNMYRIADGSNYYFKGRGLSWSPVPAWTLAKSDFWMNHPAQASCLWPAF